MRLVDEFSELLVKPAKTPAEQQLIELCLHGIERPTISRVPFSLLVASYQAALRDPQHTLEIIGRTEYAAIAKEDSEIIINELQFIDAWLEKSAPEEITFSLQETFDGSRLTEPQKQFLVALGDKIAGAPDGADGAWFHQAVYALKDTSGLPPKELFTTLYRALIDKDSGPRAGWFLSILPREWLIKRLHLKA